MYGYLIEKLKKFRLNEIASVPSTRVCVHYLRETYVMCIFVQHAGVGFLSGIVFYRRYLDNISYTVHCVFDQCLFLVKWLKNFVLAERIDSFK